MRFFLLFLLCSSSFIQAQFSIDGTLVPSIDSDWAILYKVEGAKQHYIQNTKIVNDTIVVAGEKQVVGNFHFTLPQNTKIGAYRVTYRLEGAGFADFIFNREDVNFVVNPDYPEQTISFSASEENILYLNYLREIVNAQQVLDSIQITAIRNPNTNQSTAYKNALSSVNKVQNIYRDASNGKYVQPFIKATSRVNSPNVKTTPEEYMQYMTDNFFSNIDFENNVLLNSPFLIDRITDYIFYVNIADDEKIQQDLYKNSVATVLAKIEDINFKGDVLEFLINQFAGRKDVILVDYLFENFYNKLPSQLQDSEFRQSQLKSLSSAIGRKAPDFSWIENGKNMNLHTLKDAKNYVLVFWSSDCSHCLNEIPKLHTFLKDKPNIKVVAFSLERNDFGWKNMIKTLPNWHHVIGLNKWENKIARTYDINATPTYFLLNENKIIIGKPDKLQDVKNAVNEL
ncbi:thioredoxin family protein [Polaribacter sp.]|nr:thioredoxin family protein [Polaribacter sp.]